MKKSPVYVFLICLITFSACGKKNADLDPEGRLMATALTSNSGSLDFTPMQHSDSAYVKKFTPIIYTYKDQPYTGAIAAYNEKNILIMTGNLTNGIASGEWKFYFVSGVIQVEGTYTNGMETGMWKSYFTKDKIKIAKFYDEQGFMLMRKEYFDNGKIKNYQNVKCPQFGNRERRVQFKYNGEIDYLDAEREIGKLPPAELNTLLQTDQLLKK